VCTILLAWRCLADAPVVLAANRDELVDRPSRPPARVASDPPVAAGTDLLAGGTWLAVAADGRLAAVTNRRSGPDGEIGRDPTRRSRGELPLAVLGGSSDEGARRVLSGLDPAAYNPVNVLYVSPTAALVAHLSGAELHLVALDPGPHVLTVHDVDDPRPAKDVALAARLRTAVAAAGPGPALLAGMEEMLRDHGAPGGDPLDAVCIHGDRYGTVSASSVLVAASGRVTDRHAQGRPCTTPFEDVSALLG
jgi:hypothetical protein